MWSGETGLEQRRPKDSRLEWASRGGQVWVGTERGRIPGPEAQQEVHRGFQSDSSSATKTLSWLRLGEQATATL